MTDAPERIWLEPARKTYADEGRQWCQDDVWKGDEDGPSVEYVRANIAAPSAPAQNEAAALQDLDDTLHARGIAETDPARRLIRERLVDEYGVTFVGERQR